MKRFRAVPFAIVATMVSFYLTLSPAHAQAFRTYVSGTGDDDNGCSRTAPCKTFAGAISKTAINGQINCLDPGGFGQVTITKSITIDCHDNSGAISNSGAEIGITVNFDSFSQSDTLKTVNLRNMDMDGAATGTIGINITGAGQGSVVNIEDCVISGDSAAPAGGITDDRARGALVINNTTVRNMGSTGISIASSSSGSRRAVISNTRVINSNIGIDVGADANVVIERSVVSNNTIAGLMVASTGVVMVDSTTISHNGNGIQNSSGTVRISNSNFFLNTAAISGSVGSFTNNRFVNNGSVGTLIPVGTAANPTGQQ
jgi:hypothetical protein